MEDEQSRFRNLITQAHKPLSEDSLYLTAHGHSPRMIAKRLIETGFAIIRTHYGLNEVKNICDRELYIFDKTWKNLD